MSTIKTMGIVTHSMPQGESDRIVTLLSEDLGRITVSAPGSRRSGNHLSPGTQTFAYGEFVLFRGKSMYRMNACEVRASFYDLASSLDRLVCGSALASMADDCCTNPEIASETVRLLVVALQTLKRGAMDQALLTAAFALRIFHVLGMTPHVTGCTKCGTKAIDRIGFGFAEHGFLCEECISGSPDSMVMATGCAKAMLHVLCAPEREVFRFSLDEAVSAEFIRLVKHYADTLAGGIRYPQADEMEKYNYWRST